MCCLGTRTSNCFFLSGEGLFNEGLHWEPQTAVEVGMGETIALLAHSDSEFVWLRLPNFN